MKIAGTVAAAGTASMAIQLINWYNCSDLGNFVSSLINKDGYTATKISNSEDGIKILTISSETTATVVACYFTPVGKTIVGTVVHHYNAIISKIIAVLPSGVSITINGVPLMLIKL